MAISFGGRIFRNERGFPTRKDLIAPIVVTVPVCAWPGVYLAMAAGLLQVPEAPVLVKALFVIVSLTLDGMAVYNLVERVHEIRSGEEDDLDN